MTKKALITGIAGQDGSYLAELLLEKGYEVHGILRSSMTNPYSNIKNIISNLNLFYGDITNPEFVKSIDWKIYDEIYHLAAQSHVGLSFNNPSYTWNVNYNATVLLLDSIYSVNPNARFYFAATSELYGDTPGIQNESTPFNPVSPYANSKLEALESCRIFRKNNRFVSGGLLFNHESCRRGKDFVTQKIIQAFKEYMKDSTKNILILGNLDAKRDWGYSPDYVKAMWQMLQHTHADDFVVATNETHSIKDFILECAQQSGVQIKIIENVKDSNIDYAAINNYEYIINDHNTLYILQSETFYRPNEVDFLLGDYTKIKNKLGWTPTVYMNELISIMLLGED